MRIFGQIIDKQELIEVEDARYRNDIVVELAGQYYPISIVAYERFCYDFEYDAKHMGYYNIRPNCVITETIENKFIIKTLNHLADNGYFNYIKPLESVLNLNLVELT